MRFVSIYVDFVDKWDNFVDKYCLYGGRFVDLNERSKINSTCGSGIATTHFCRWLV
jgi:hypothetical protein